MTENQVKELGKIAKKVIEDCEKQISIVGVNASYGRIMKGRWGKSDYRYFFKEGSPKGEIVNDYGNGTIYVLFKASEVKDFILLLMNVVNSRKQEKE